MAVTAEALVATGERLLEAIAARDFDGIAGCFAADASFRVLTPGPLRELTGPGEAAGRYRAWLETLEEYDVLERDAAAIADRVRIRYLFRGRDPEKGWRLNEHTGYAAVRDGKIASMILTCAGFRPTAAQR
ncbi:MAG: nuclear transport factor 2 family protein [Gaiellaceae bacterium]